MEKNTAKSIDSSKKKGDTANKELTVEEVDDLYTGVYADCLIFEPTFDKSRDDELKATTENASVEARKSLEVDIGKIHEAVGKDSVTIGIREKGKASKTNAKSKTSNKEKEIEK